MPKGYKMGREMIMLKLFLLVLKFQCIKDLYYVQCTSLSCIGVFGSNKNCFRIIITQREIQYEKSQLRKLG